MHMSKEKQIENIKDWKVIWRGVIICKMKNEHDSELIWAGGWSLIRFIFLKSWNNIY
jgi:hypothetical protein